MPLGSPDAGVLIECEFVSGGLRGARTVVHFPKEPGVTHGWLEVSSPFATNKWPLKLAGVGDLALDPALSAGLATFVATVTARVTFDGRDEDSV